MPDQSALPLRERFEEWISNSDEKKGGEIDAVKKKRLDEAGRLAKVALTVEKEERNTGISRDLKVDSGGKKPLAKVRSGCTRPGESIPPPTPPRSPVEDIRASLNDHEAEIAILRLEIEKIQMEVLDLYKQCRKASEEVAKAMCQGDKAKLKISKKLEEDLLKLVEQKEQTINELRDEIVERKRREGELREEIAEAEGRRKMRKAMPTENKKPVKKGSSSAERCNIGESTSDWQFRRRQGTRDTPFTAGCQVLFGKR